MMNFNMPLSCKSFTIILGSFVGLVIFSPASNAVPTSAVNPCPGIYYEEPHNSLRIVPEGCAPNSITKLRNEPAKVPDAVFVDQAVPIQAPLPEEQQIVVTTITPQMGKVTVEIRNSTNAQVTYQAIGHTEQRMLENGQNIVLTGLPIPLTVTFTRSDAGLVKVTPIDSSEPGVLTLMLDEAKGLTDSQSSVRVQSTGKVSTY